MIRISKFAVLTGLLVCLSSCGRYGKPLPPEYLAPTAVQSLNVSAGLEGVKFAWEAPGNDRRGKPLKSIEGYKILRRDDDSGNSSNSDRQSNFQVVTTVSDTHLLELERAKQAALAEDKPARRMKAPAESTKFSFMDSSVQSGKAYLYRIYPYNQSGVLGQSKQTVRVLFNGESSQVAMLPSPEDLEDEDLF